MPRSGRGPPACCARPRWRWTACAERRASSATTRLRIGHLPDSLPTSVGARDASLRRQHSARTDQPRDRSGAPPRSVKSRANRLDAVVVGLPAPTSGLRATPAGHQRIVAALPVTHPHAVGPAVSLARLAPERLVVLPADTNPAFHNAMVSACRDAGLSPTFVEVGEPRVEHALLAVASGAGMALLPESAAERHLAPGRSIRPGRDRRARVRECRDHPSGHREPRHARLPAHPRPGSGAPRALGVPAPRVSLAALHRWPYRRAGQSVMSARLASKVGTGWPSSSCRHPAGRLS